MKLIITESLTEAWKFAEVLNSRFRKPGYFQGKEYFISWIEEKARETGDGQILHIPFILNDLENIQIGIIEQLMNNSKSLIIATGAGYEGENKFWKIYKWTNSKLPYQRMWLNELTKKAIIDGMNNLGNVNKFQSLHKNKETEDLSQLESDIYYFIYNEQFKISQKKSQIQYKIELKFKSDLMIIKSLSKQIWSDLGTINQIMQMVERRKKLIVDAVKYEDHTITAPKLYNLIDIQIECNKELGFTPIKTLSILTELYYKGLITYPQTNSRKIKPSQLAKIPEILFSLSFSESTKEFTRTYTENYMWKRFSKNITGKEEDFFQGIMPTRKIPSNLEKSHQAVYDRIAIRFIESLSEPHQFSSVEVNLNSIDYHFATHSKIIKNLGWKIYQNYLFEDGIDFLHHQPEFRKNEQFIIEGARIIEVKSFPEFIKEADILKKFHTEGNPLSVTKAIESLIRKGKLIRECNKIKAK